MSVAAQLKWQTERIRSIRKMLTFSQPVSLVSPVFVEELFRLEELLLWYKVRALQIFAEMF